MCGIVGIIQKRKDVDLTPYLRALAVEAQIRGQHATGIMEFLSDGREIMAMSQPKPAKDIVCDVWGWRWIKGVNAVFLHTRYSTSNLQYNQPITNHDSIGTIRSSIMHNGVVTQALPEHWKGLFGHDFETKNDTEILAKEWDVGRHPLQLKGTSQACVLLDTKTSSIYWWRNGERPLWFAEFEDFYVVASTRDIIERALGDDYEMLVSCIPGRQYSVTLTKPVSEIVLDSKAIADCADLQKRNIEW